MDVKRQSLSVARVRLSPMLIIMHQKLALTQIFRIKLHAQSGTKIVIQYQKYRCSKIGKVSQLNTNFCFTFSSACFLHWNGTNYRGNSQASPFVTHIPLPCSQSLLLPIARLPLRIKRATSSSLIRCRSQEVMDVIRPSVAEPVGWTPRSSGYSLAVRGEGVRNRRWRGWSESCIVT